MECLLAPTPPLLDAIKRRSGTLMGTVEEELLATPSAAADAAPSIKACAASASKASILESRDNQNFNQEITGIHHNKNFETLLINATRTNNILESLES